MTKQKQDLDSRETMKRSDALWNSIAPPPERSPESYLMATTYAFDAEDENVIEVIASSGRLNRLDEIIDVRGGKFDNYLKNPVVLWAHEWDSLPIGRALSLKIRHTAEDGSDALVIRVEFSPLEEAQSIKELYKRGFLNAFSIGFITNDATRDKEKGIRRVTDWEMLELSCVVIPADANALVATLSLLTQKEDKHEEIDEVWRDTANRMRHLTSEIYKARSIDDTELAMLCELANHAITLMALNKDEAKVDIALAANFFIEALMKSTGVTWLDFVRIFGEKHNIWHNSDSRFQSLLVTLENVKKRALRAH